MRKPRKYTGLPLEEVVLPLEEVVVHNIQAVVHNIQAVVHNNTIFASVAVGTIFQIV